VGFAAETGEDAELSEPGTEDPAARGCSPLCAGAPGILAFSSSRVAELRAAGAQRPPPQIVRAISGIGPSLEPEERNRRAFPGPSHHRARSGHGHPWFPRAEGRLGR
jgi:hypothetical protein